MLELRRIYSLAWATVVVRILGKHARASCHALALRNADSVCALIVLADVLVFTDPSRCGVCGVFYGYVNGGLRIWTTGLDGKCGGGTCNDFGGHLVRAGAICLLNAARQPGLVCEGRGQS